MTAHSVAEHELLDWDGWTLEFCSKREHGGDVALSADGTTALIAGHSEGTPSVRVFVRSDSTWRMQAELTSGSSEMSFGSSVALSADGNTALVGEPHIYINHSSPVGPHHRVQSVTWSGPTTVRWSSADPDRGGSRSARR
jgi:hypothetical protein